VSGNPRVLIIDDEEAICDLIGAVAESAGFSAVSASEPDAIREAIQGEFDLVVLDLSLGLVDGIEMMGALGARHKGLPLILVSGADQALIESAGRIAEMHKLRVLGTFSKPVSLDVLRAAMLEWSEATARASDPTGPKVVITADELLDPEHLYLAYQPKVSTSTGRVVGAEALVRWKHDEHGEISPAILVSIIEREGRNAELLDAVMKMAARDRARYPSLAALEDVSLNISVLDLDDDELPRRAQRILLESSKADTWTFEVTESSPIIEIAPSLSILTRLRLAGFGLAVDDFGTGTSNYERLLVAPFTELKIDRALVRRLRGGSVDPDPIVRSSVEVGHSLGLIVIAEGVETSNQYHIIRNLGCDIAQGFLIARPVAPEHFASAVKKWNRSAANPHRHSGT
jgi:EAL domain-containing protein (putative c-di-GMP-specific phosphodiesterase class I)